MVKASKIFLPDSGLLAQLIGLNTAVLNAAPSLPCALAETFVLSKLLKHLSFSTQGLRLWHYRTQGGLEVDFLLEDRTGMLIGIETTAFASITFYDFRALCHSQETEKNITEWLKIGERSVTTILRLYRKTGSYLPTPYPGWQPVLSVEK